MALGYKDLLARAEAAVTSVAADAAPALHTAGEVVFVDIRDPRELERDGTVVGALHAPRGMLEFWVDPASPYFKTVFADESREYVLFCGAGWRSALATKTLQDMGMRNVAHIDGGFAAWKKQGAPIETLEARKAKKG